MPVNLYKKLKFTEKYYLENYGNYVMYFCILLCRVNKIIMNSSHYKTCSFVFQQKGQITF